MVDVLPRQLGHVDEAVHAAEVDEGAEVDHRRDDAVADLARLEVGEEVLALLLLRLLEPGPTGQHDVVAVLVELDDLGLERPADVGLQVAHPAQLDERCGQEAAQADVEDQAALDDLDDRAADDAVLFLDLLDVAPGPLVLGPLLGQDQAALLVLLLEDEGFDLVAHADDLGGIDVVADRQLAGGDHALGLVADVEQDLVPVDLDDRALDDLAVLDLDHRAVDGVLERHAAEVVLDDWLGGVFPFSASEGVGCRRVEGLGVWPGRTRGRLLSGWRGAPSELGVEGRRRTLPRAPSDHRRAAEVSARGHQQELGVLEVRGGRRRRPGSPTTGRAPTGRPARPAGAARGA